MVMAAARTLARRRMGACETTPPATLREHQRDPDKPTANEPFLALEDLPPLAGVELVVPPLRGCGRSSLPLAARRQDRQLRGRIQKNSQPRPGGARSHRVRFVRPLDTGGPYGCRRPGRYGFRGDVLICRCGCSGLAYMVVPSSAVAARGS